MRSLARWHSLALDELRERGNAPTLASLQGLPAPLEFGFERQCVTALQLGLMALDAFGN